MFRENLEEELLALYTLDELLDENSLTHEEVVSILLLAGYIIPPQFMNPYDETKDGTKEET